MADATIGAHLELTASTGDCWTHSHPHERNVYDFTEWTIRHPGNYDIIILRNGRNPITAFALQAATEIRFPSSHPLARWKDNAGKSFAFVGVLGQVVDFAELPAQLQTPGMAAAVKAVNNRGKMVRESCGSRGEVANVPSLGNYYLNMDHTQRQGLDQDFSIWYASKFMVWQNVVLTAPDQLRQRVAWALFQIMPVSARDFTYDNLVETWATYYDIFIHNAFGNYGDILHEVSRSPLMGQYLTFLDNRKAANGNYPDENFAREVNDGNVPLSLMYAGLPYHCARCT